MPFIFINEDLATVRRLYLNIGKENFISLCHSKGIPPPIRPSDLVLEYENDRFYLARVLPMKNQRILEVDYYLKRYRLAAGSAGVNENTEIQKIQKNTNRY